MCLAQLCLSIRLAKKTRLGKKEVRRTAKCIIYKSYER